jgi:hypothetical protein
LLTADEIFKRQAIEIVLPSDSVKAQHIKSVSGTVKWMKSGKRKQKIHCRNEYDLSGKLMLKKYALFNTDAFTSHENVYRYEGERLTEIGGYFEKAGYSDNTYTYSDKGNVQAIDHLFDREEFTYDSLGKVLTMTRWSKASMKEQVPDARYSFVYNDLGQLVSVFKMKENDQTYTTAISYIYDEYNRLQKITIHDWQSVLFRSITYVYAGNSKDSRIYDVIYAYGNQWVNKQSFVYEAGQLKEIVYYEDENQAVRKLKLNYEYYKK